METNKQLYRHQVGALPLVKHIIKRLHLRDIFHEHVTKHANEIIPAVDSLLLLIYNLAIGKIPLYKLEKWVDSIDLRYFGYENSQSSQFNDDRFGRTLDKLYKTDRASLMTKIVLSSIENFELDLNQMHNDSTSVKAYGKISGKTKMGLEMNRGNSKDHRPDLKQLIFNLTISVDGGVPIHYKTYSGNRTDDTIHIETWNTLSKICKKSDFLYVADSKLCTDGQLSHITSHGGRAITIVPNTWGETQAFKGKLRKTKIAKTEIWRRVKPGTLDEIEYFSVYKGDYFTETRGYRLHWIYSSEKRNRDRESRNKRLQKAEKELAELIGKLNTKKYKTKEAIISKSQEILEKYNVNQFIDIQIGTTKAREIKQLGKGRPGPQTEYEEIIEELFTLYWLRNVATIKEEMNLDGIFPLLSTDTTLKAEEVLKAYKYQPKIEKRFSQFKSIHNAAPLLFKNIERVEANMFVFFAALMVQALIEREMQKSMKDQNISSIDVYPEQRYCEKPTTNVIFELFEPISTYEIKNGSRVIEAYHDKLDETQKNVIKLLGMTEKEYWNYAAPNH